VQSTEWPGSDAYNQAPGAFQKSGRRIRRDRGILLEFLGEKGNVGVAAEIALLRFMPHGPLAAANMSLPCSSICSDERPTSTLKSPGSARHCFAFES
jgi:hypothetical protein